MFSRCYGLQTVGLRYFNVFGQRQDPEGPYAAIIPRWIAAIFSGKSVYINGDGESSRDFRYVENVVQANLLSALAHPPVGASEVFNVAVGERTTLNQLFTALADALAPIVAPKRFDPPIFWNFGPGDVRHSLADTSHASRVIGDAPTHGFATGCARPSMGMPRNSAPPQTDVGRAGQRRPVTPRYPTPAAAVRPRPISAWPCVVWPDALYVASARF